MTDMGEKNEISTIEPEVQGGASFKSFLRIFSYASRRDGLLYGLAILGSIAVGSTLPLMTIVFGGFVTTFTNFATGQSQPDEFRRDVNGFTLWFIYLFIARFVLTYATTVAVTIAGARITRKLRVTLLKQALRQDISYFDEKTSNSVATQVTTACNNVNQGIAEKFLIAVQAVSTFFAGFVVAFAVQWKLTLITICVAPALLTVTFVTVGMDAVHEAALQKHYAEAASMAEEVFSTIKTVHAFWAQPALIKRFDAVLLKAQRTAMKKSLPMAVLYCAEYFFVYSGFALCFWQGVRMYASGEITESGKIVSVLLSVIISATAINILGPNITAFATASGAAEGLFEIIDRESKIDPFSKEGQQLSDIKGNILLKNVTFSYPSRQDVPVLQGMDLTIPAGETTALVGASGSGKSTVIGLLERWYDHAGGEISVDGVDIRELNVHWLRTNIRLVQQEPVLFSGTIFDNVANGLVGSAFVTSDEQTKRQLVKEACKLANADDFITKLPMQYDTAVGERASMLSGGQKQRIAIARSIISNPKILLLDEATSALDPQAEKIVQAALDRASEGRTTLVIAHKLATVRKANNIVVISQGRVIEQGSHDELCAAGGAYARMVSSQSLGEKDFSDIQEETAIKQQKTLEKSHTRLSMVEASSRLKRASTNYGFFKSLWIVISEQPNLWFKMFLCLLLSILGGFILPAQALLFPRLLEVFELPEDRMRSRGNFFALMFFVLAIANLFIFFTLGWVTNIVSQVSTHRYRLELFEIFIRQDMEFFDRKDVSAGSIASDLSSKPTSLQELVGITLTLQVFLAVSLFGSVILALAYGWKLGLVVCFGGLVPIVFFGYLRARIDTKLDMYTSKRFSSGAGLAAEAVSAIRTVSSLALEDVILGTYREQLNGVVHKSIPQILWAFFWYALSQSFEFLAMALGFWYGGQLLARGEYSTTQFFTVFTAVIFGGQSVAQMFAYSSSVAKMTSAANYIFTLRQSEPVIKETKNSKENGPDGDGAVRLSDVSFWYPQRPEAPVLKHISLGIGSGLSVAFVGASGSGKSTIVSLLERFYDPTLGLITLDNKDVKEMSPRLLRAQIALVQQEPVLYRGSIRENIAMGLESGATEKQVEDACRQANILNFIQSLPEGLGTSCGNRGLQLSGGQRQRIAIARALIRDPQLLLLDEATSALDTESERYVQKALKEASRGRTTIAVAHRLSTIKDADVIFVVGQGTIVEQGSHEELTRLKGTYYKMCLAQSLDQPM